jgi:hypothetical protein
MKRGDDVTAEPHPDWGIDPKSLPVVLTPEAFPAMPLGSPPSIWGFAGKDLAAKDMTGLPVGFLANITFDEGTIWPPPQHLPAGFSPAEWMETAKSPGLRVRSLHRKGITGKGVSVAVFDKPILPTHAEFRGHIHYYRVAAPRPENDRLHFHGAACASILAGRTCGVAPEADLFYFGVPDNGQNARNYLLAIDELILVNESLPDNRKIRLVSISDGFGPGSDDEALWEKLVERAEAAGLMLIYSNRLRRSGFLCGGCAPYLDRDKPLEHKLANHLVGKVNPADVVLIPSDCRTTAANWADGSYIYWGSGGFSWAIAYAAGLFTLALSIAPALSYTKITESLVASKTPCRDGAFIVDPVRFVETISSGCF